LKEFPPCAENICPKAKWMSDFQKQLWQNNKLKLSKCPKLIPHLYEHKNYCIHYRNSKFVEKLGVDIGDSSCH
jgi:hypothetical protein